MDRVLYLAKTSNSDTHTPCEHTADVITMTLEKLCIAASSTLQLAPPDITGFREKVSELIEYLDRWFSVIAGARQAECDFLMDKSWAGLNAPHWMYFHSAFLLLDVCRFTLATVDYLEGQALFIAVLGPDFLSKAMTRLKEIVRKVCRNVRQHAAEQRERLQKPDAVHKLLQVILGQPADLEDPVGEELRKLVDESWLDEIIEKLRTSWVEAINGIGEVKVF